MPPKVEPEPVPIDDENETSAKGGGGCCCKGKVGPDGPVKVDPAFWTNKTCHDFSFCILFLVFWVGMVFVLIMAATNGNGNGVESLAYGKDWQGTTCGIKNAANAAEDSLLNPQLNNRSAANC